jgi:hypothetical protein
MQRLLTPLGTRIALLAALLFVAASVMSDGIARGQGTQQPAGPRITQTVVLDDDKFNVRRLTFPAGYRQQMHTVGADRDELVILITPGQFEGRVDAAVRVATKPGELWAVPKAPSQHAFANLGKEPLDILVVQRK